MKMEVHWKLEEIVEIEINKKLHSIDELLKLI
jgi:hypothetical protein